MQEWCKTRAFAKKSAKSTSKFSTIPFITYSDLKRDLNQLDSDENIAVVFSHGLTSSKIAYINAYKLFAKQGIPVYAVDHSDRSCTISTLKDGTLIKY